MRTYSMRTPLFFVRDSPERIDFHIRSGDYLSYLATLMGFLEEALEKCTGSGASARERELARELRRDLKFVHANYKVVPRDLGDVRDMHPSRNLLSK